MDVVIHVGDKHFHVQVEHTDTIAVEYSIDKYFDRLLTVNPNHDAIISARKTSSHNCNKD